MAGPPLSTLLPIVTAIAATSASTTRVTTVPNMAIVGLVNTANWTAYEAASPQPIGAVAVGVGGIDVTTVFPATLDRLVYNGADPAIVDTNGVPLGAFDLAVPYP